MSESSDSSVKPKKKKPRKFSERIVKTKDAPLERWERTEGDDVLGVGSGEWRKTERDWVKFDLSRPKKAKRNPHKGTKNHNSKISDSEVDAIREQYRLGDSSQKIAIACGLSPGTIRRLVAGITYQDPKGVALTGMRSGKAAAVRGENSPKSKLTDQQVIDIRKLYDSGINCTVIAKEFGVCAEYVGDLGKRKYRKDIKEFDDGATKRPKRTFNAIFSDSAVQDIRRRVKNGETQASVARELNVSKCTVSLIVLRKHYGHVPD